MRSDWIVVGGMRIDLNAIRGIKHRCEPSLCADRERCCCACYEVCVEECELERLIGLLPEAARLARHLKPNGQLDNPFDPVGDGLFAMDTDDDGLCTFAFQGPRREVLCSLHAAAEKLGLDPYQSKPFSCVLWPLAITEGEDRVLTVDGGAFGFPCNRRRDRSLPGLDPEIERIVLAAFGLRARDEILRAIAASTDQPGLYRPAKGAPSDRPAD